MWGWSREARSLASTVKRDRIDSSTAKARGSCLMATSRPELAVLAGQDDAPAAPSELPADLVGGEGVDHRLLVEAHARGVALCRRRAGRHQELGLVQVLVVLLLEGTRGGREVAEDEEHRGADHDGHEPGARARDPHGQRGQGEDQDEPEADARGQEAQPAAPAVGRHPVAGHRQQDIGEGQDGEDQQRQAEEAVDRDQAAVDVGDHRLRGHHGVLPVRGARRSPGSGRWPGHRGRWCRARSGASSRPARGGRPRCRRRRRSGRSRCPRCGPS